MWWPPFLYPPPASALMAGISTVQFAALAKLGLGELRGENMAYSKFWQVWVGKQQKSGFGGGGGGVAMLPSRSGMLAAYVPALVAALASFAVPGAVEGVRTQLLSAAISVHFLKRVLEVLDGALQGDEVQRTKKKMHNKDKGLSGLDLSDLLLKLDDPSVCMYRLGNGFIPLG
ncbi:hypothetical protein GUJ93_ZPchr0013g34592 [Zizania palustris]|uniref:Uncharacterized protein n=1 Tax=Zizania palustris TaxID=103762 RepID=A0A8J5X9X7_ZIZPA|nr:hypothetical protein GUJ93_ZPchr0013g34592 [Zizania palustris]